MGKVKTNKDAVPAPAAPAPLVDLKYYQIKPILEALAEWWRVKGLPVPFQTTVLRSMRAVEAERETFTEIHKRLLDQYTVKDEKGEPAFNEETGRYIFEDEDGFNAGWKELNDTDFKAPTIPAKDVFELAEPLGLTMAMLAVLYDETGKQSLMSPA